MTKVFFLLFLPLFLWASPLHDAVSQNSTEAAASALKNGIDINGLKEGRTALSLAVISRNIDMIKYLVNAKADVNKGGRSPLLEALLLEDISIASYLIDHGAKVDQNGYLTRNSMLYDLLLERKYESVKLLLKHQAKFSKSMTMGAFYLALTYAPFDVIKAFISRDVPMNQRDPYLGTPVDIALRYRRNDVLEYLVDNGASVVNYSHYLKVATEDNNTNAVKILVDGEIKVSKRLHYLLALAVKENNLEILKQLVTADGDLNRKDRNGDTPLVVALKYDRKEIAEWIINQDISATQNAKALYYTIQYRDTNATLHMMEEGIGAKTLNEDGLTPLLWALLHKRYETAQALIEQGSYINNEDSLGETALFKVIRLHQNDLLDILLHRGAKINFYNKEGVSPIYKSVESANFAGFKALVSAGATLEENDLEKSEIYLAVQRGLVRFYFFLKSRSALAYNKDSKGNRLIHIAAMKNRLDILRMMLLNGTSTEYKNIRGETPLHVAAKEGMLDAVALLTFFHANLDAKDERGRTVKEIASSYKQTKVVKWIERYKFEQEKALKVILDEKTKRSAQTPNKTAL